MTINYTTLLGLAQPVTGTEEGTWGDTVNDAITALVEQAVAGGATIDVTAGDVTLTSTDGVSNQARNAILLVTGTPGTSRNVIAPSKSKIYIVKNSSDGSIVLKGSATTGVTIPVGVEAVCFWNGSDFEIAALTGPSTATDNAVARFDGTTGKVIQNSAVTIADTSGDITGGRYNKITITAPANGSTLTILDGKVLTVNNTLTLAGTDSTTMTFPSTSASIARTDAGQTFTGDQVIAGNLTMNAQGDVRFADSDSSNWVAFQGPATVASNVTWTLPATDGSSGQVLSTNGSGTLSWATTVSTPGGSDTQIQYNSSNTFAGAAGLTTDGSNLTVRAQGDVRFADSDSSNWVAFQGAATIASNVTWTLPSADGTSGQFLSTDGSGTLSWATASGGGGGGGTSVTVTQITATASQTTFNVTYTVGQISVYLNGALLASADYTATNGTTVVLATGAAANDIFTAVVYSTVTGLTINTASPFNTWVGSSAGAANTTGANNVAVGYQALDANTIGERNTGIGSGAIGANTTGVNNTAVGFVALGANTTGQGNVVLGAYALDANTSGNDNVALGTAALGANTTGANNVAIGSYALDANQTGIANVAIGYDALGANTSNYNNAIGYQAMFTNTTGTRNVAVGYQALYSNTTGSDNVAVGHGALRFNTTGFANVAFGSDVSGYSALYSNTTGTNNSAFGAGALGKNTTASNNTAIGYLSLYSNTTGDNNTAVGYGALDANTTGVGNVAMGTDALGGNTTGIRNVAIGLYAMRAGGNGGYNIAIGAYSMYDGPTGAENIGIGEQSLYALTSGNYNTAIGRLSLTANTTGSYNTAVGYKAADAVTTAEDITAVGRDAGGACTTGTDNTFLGAAAGSSVTTGASNVIVGRNAQASAVGASNQIVIGPNVTGQADTNVTIGNASGKIYNAYTVNATWTQTSDERLKKNIQDDTLGLSFVNRLRPVKYQWKPSNEIDPSLPYYNPENKRDTETVMHGLVAQEVKAALDAEGVTTFAGWDVGSDTIQAISREMFITPLIKAIQELSAKCDALQAEVNQLKGK